MIMNGEKAIVMTFFQASDVLGDLEDVSVIALALRPEHPHASFHVLGAFGAAFWDERVLLEGLAAGRGHADAA